VSTPIDGLDPVELTEFARLAVADFDAQSQSLARFLPYRGIPDIRYAYSKGVDALVDEATYRAFDAESPIGRRPGTSRVSGELPAISRKVPLGEYDQLRLRNASDTEVVDGVFADAARLARGIAARVEGARGQLFTTGTVVLDENGVELTYSSGRHGTLTISTLASNDRWSAYSTATPIADILAWKELIRAQSGVTPDTLLVSETVMAHLQQVAEVRGAFMAVANAPAMVTRDVVSQAFVALAGVRVEVYVPPAGMVTPPIPATKVVLLASNVPLGFTAYGITLEASEPGYAGLGAQPGVVAGSWKEHDPVAVWTKAAAIALPLLGAPDCTLSAQVIA
jgi:hypothetical protein